MPTAAGADVLVGNTIIIVNIGLADSTRAGVPCRADARDSCTRWYGYGNVILHERGANAPRALDCGRTICDTVAHYGSSRESGHGGDPVGLAGRHSCGTSIVGGGDLYGRR